jgi:DeoR/GlpR family transcriptional regulator of sugar metabolism
VLASERQIRIVEEVRRNGAVRVSDLSRRFGVSDMTIRRDLDALAGRRLLEKVHGGAVAPERPRADEPGFEAKWVRQEAEKEAIAHAAAALATPGLAVGISAGTTTWRLAHQLRDVRGLTVVTNSIQVAQVLYGADPALGQTVVLTGGVRTPSDALVGPVAISAVQQVHLDLLFLGVHGMDPVAGLSTPNLLEGEVNRALVAASRRLVVLADHTKWKEIGLVTIAPLQSADVLVTDDGLPDEALHRLRDDVGELIVARAGAAPPYGLGS